jgi:hypothetical protein
LQCQGALDRHEETCLLRRPLKYIGALLPTWRNWQTRQTQNLVLVRVCGFDPLRRHHVFPVIRIHTEGKAPFGISNEWFRSLGVRQGETYDFFARIHTLALFHGRANFLASHRCLPVNWHHIH